MKNMQVIRPLVLFFASLFLYDQVERKLNDLTVAKTVGISKVYDREIREMAKKSRVSRNDMALIRRSE